MARRAVRDNVKHHGGRWRAVTNPNLPEKPQPVVILEEDYGRVC